jgi:hypothetical protein
MSTQEETDHRSLEVIVRSPCTVLDDMVLECPGFTWNQVFIAMDCLSRARVLTISPKEHGQSVIHVRITALRERAQVHPPR